MTDSWYENIFEEYKLRYLFESDRISKWYPYTNDSIIILFENGAAAYYDNIYKTYTYKKSLKELEEFLTVSKDTTKDEEEYKEKWHLMFAKKLYVKMFKAGLNQMMLSDRTGISQASIAGYVNGKRTPTLYAAKKIADALGCTVNDLIDF